MFARGYTLIEILIVLFIVSIVTTIGLLSIHRNDNKEMETFATELTQLLSLAEEQALLEPRVLGMSVTEHAVQFAHLQQQDSQPVWVVRKEPTLGLHKVSKHIQLAIKAVGESLKFNTEKDGFNPQVVISTNGEITPFTIYIGKQGEKPRYAVISDANGHVTSKALT